MLIWADNCGPHKTDAIKAVFRQWGIYTAWLPPNMTGMLQVLDLVVNGPIKAHFRNIRARRIVDAFRQFREDYAREMEKPIGLRQRLKFKPPKPSYQEAMQDLFSLFASSFTVASFKEGVIQSFLDTGTQPPSPLLAPGFVGPEPCPVFKQYKEENGSGTIIFSEDKIVKSAIDGVLDGDDSDDSDSDGNESDNAPGNCTYAGSEDEEYEVDES